MRNTFRIAVAGLILLWAAADAAAQVRGGARPRAQAPTTSVDNPYGLSNCAERPFARDCDRRGQW